MSTPSCPHGIVGACKKCQADARLALLGTLAKRVEMLTAQIQDGNREIARLAEVWRVILKHEAPILADYVAVVLGQMDALAAREPGSPVPERPQAAPTITTSAEHRLRPGNVISVMTMDRRPWRRLLHWVLRRGPPQIARLTRVTASSPNVVFLDKERPQ